MKTALLALVGVLILSELAYAQPVRFDGPVERVSFDGDNSIEVNYTGYSRKIRSTPEMWLIEYGLAPAGMSRILRANRSRVQFSDGEVISSASSVLVTFIDNGPLPPKEAYGLSLLSFLATMFDEWDYRTEIHTYENFSQLVFGVRLSLSTGIHYGWLRFNRPSADSHTQFDLVEYAFHPLPGAPIAAGEQPMLPPITSQRTPEGLTFTWDTRWGAFVLESATNLIPPMSWEVINRDALSPVSVPTGDAQRLFRLRLP